MAIYENTNADRLFERSKMEFKRESAEKIFCSGLTTEQLEKAGPGAVKELVEAVKKALPNGNLPLSLKHIQEVEKGLKAALAKFEAGE